MRAWAWGLCALGIVGAPVAHAAEPTKSRPRTSIYAGMEFGESDSRRLEAGATFHPNDRWRASLSMSRSEFDLPGMDAASKVTTARVRRHSDDFGIGVGARRAEINHVSLTRGWMVNGFVDRGAWRFSMEVDSRETDLAPAAFSDEQIPGLGAVSGIADCGIDSLGFLGNANVTHKRWSAFASLRVFQYEDFDCTLIIDGEEGTEGPGGRDAERLAENTLDIVTGFGSRLIPREATLLESSLAIGGTFAIDAEWLAGAEIYRDVERTGDDVFLTGLAFANRPVTELLNLEFWLGYAKATGGDSAFLGVRLTAEL
jgi:hypothetical protein